MKKLILTIILSAGIVSSSVFAQDSTTDKRGKMQIGAKIGGNYSNVYDSQGEQFSADPTFGLAVGTFLKIPLGKYLGVQPEVMFSQHGFKATGVLFGSTYDLTRTTSYLEIPLLVSLKPFPGITILAGPQYSYLINVKNQFKNASTTILQEQAFDNDDLRKNTLAFTFGGDVDFDHLVVGARIGWDLTNNNADGTSSTPRYKNTWTQVTLGYLFF